MKTFTILIVLVALWNTSAFQRTALKVPNFRATSSIGRPHSSRFLLRQSIRPVSRITGHSGLHSSLSDDTDSSAGIFGGLKLAAVAVLRSMRILQPSTHKLSNSISHLTKLPFTVFINRKSGGKTGKNLLDQLYRLANAAYICDLLNERPRSKLLAEVYQHGANSTTMGTALCCGGDGTVRWIMDEAVAARLTQRLCFGVLPQGTGNDLHNHILSAYIQPSADRTAFARVSQALNPSSQLSDINGALACFTSSTSNTPTHTVPFDRWEISATHSSNRPHWTSAFNNYCGLGVDGELTYAYDSLRTLRPHWFFHRLVNKMWFGLLWVYKAVRGNAKNLSRDVDLYVDGVRVDLSAGGTLRGIVLTNIASYAGGTRLWTFAGETKPADGRWASQSSEDGLIEVVGLTGWAHLAAVKSGISRPIPLAQGRNVTMVTRTRLPMQVDGEPLLHHPGRLEILKQATMQLIVPHVPSPPTQSTTD